MIAAIINWSIKNRIMVLLITAAIVAYGLFSLQKTPIDAIPDLSDVQVIVKTSYPGQAPQVVEDQVTYPLTTAMLSVPGAKTVRGYSFFGDSYVYIIFDDNTDMYWARSRVLEYLSQVAPDLPKEARSALGPDATGVGWIFSYALVDKSGKHDLSELRSLQDWFLKFELQTVAGVSEVATVGGMVKQYQVRVDPNKLRAYNLPLNKISKAMHHLPTRRRIFEHCVRDASVGLNKSTHAFSGIHEFLEAIGHLTISYFDSADFDSTITDVRGQAGGFEIEDDYGVGVGH